MRCLGTPCSHRCLAHRGGSGNTKARKNTLRRRLHGVLHCSCRLHPPQMVAHMGVASCQVLCRHGIVPYTLLHFFCEEHLACLRSIASSISGPARLMPACSGRSRESRQRRQKEEAPCDGSSMLSDPVEERGAGSGERTDGYAPGLVKAMTAAKPLANRLPRKSEAPSWIRRVLRPSCDRGMIGSSAGFYEMVGSVSGLFASACRSSEKLMPRLARGLYSSLPGCKCRSVVILVVKC